PPPALPCSALPSLPLLNDRLDRRLGAQTTNDLAYPRRGYAEHLGGLADGVALQVIRRDQAVALGLVSLYRPGRSPRSPRLPAHRFSCTAISRLIMYATMRIIARACIFIWTTIGRCPIFLSVETEEPMTDTRPTNWHSDHLYPADADREAVQGWSA